jgi:hypothetical protein
MVKTNNDVVLLADADDAAAVAIGPSTLNITALYH